MTHLCDTLLSVPKNNPHDVCPTCGKSKLVSAKQCASCYHQKHKDEGVTDEHCDGSGAMAICGTLVPHVHCECGEPMVSPAELQRGYCDEYCLAERSGDLIHCPFPAEHHGTSINHVLSQSKSAFKKQTMVFQHGELLSYEALNERSWDARQRSVEQE